VYAIHIPRQFLLGWLQHTGKSTPVFDQKSYQVSFFINPPNGELFSMNDIENYLSKLELPIENDVMKPLNNKAVIKYLLEEFSKCFEDDKNFYKKEELLRFASMLDY
jgi:hypothetical protein